MIWGKATLVRGKRLFDCFGNARFGRVVGGPSWTPMLSGLFLFNGITKVRRLSSDSLFFLKDTIWSEIIVDTGRLLGKEGDSRINEYLETN